LKEAVTAMATEWYYAKGNQQHGPVSAADLKSLAVSGQLTPQDMVRTNGMTEWKPAASVKGLFGAPAVTPPPIPPSASAPPPAAAVISQSAPPDAPSPSPSSRAKSAMSSFLSTAKAAVQLAAKQTEKTKLTTVTLPSAYRALGQESFASRSHQAELPELYQQLDAVQKEMAGIAAQQAAQPEPQSLGDKAKATAGKAMQVAHSQKLSMQQSSHLSNLGKAVYEKHQYASGTQQVVDPIREALARLTALEAEIASLVSQGKGSWITPRRLAVGGAVAIPLVLLMVFAGSLGSRNHESSAENTPTDPSLAVSSDATDDKAPTANRSNGPSSKRSYDSGLAEGMALAEAHYSGSKGLEPVELRKQHLGRVIETYDDSYRGMAKIENLLSENEKAQVAHAKGIVDGYRQKLRSLGIEID